MHTDVNQNKLLDRFVLSVRLFVLANLGNSWTDFFSGTYILPRRPRGGKERYSYV